jgi:glutamate synthase (NADPH) large chain
MSLVSFIGPKPNLLDINNINPPMRLEVSQPVLDFTDMAKVRVQSRNYSSNKFRPFELDICYPLAWGNEGVEARLASLAAQAVDAVKGGFNILIITDRALRCRAGRDSGVARHQCDPSASDCRGAAYVDRPGGGNGLGA